MAAARINKQHGTGIYSGAGGQDLPSGLEPRNELRILDSMFNLHFVPIFIIPLQCRLQQYIFAYPWIAALPTICSGTLLNPFINL